MKIKIGFSLHLALFVLILFSIAFCRIYIRVQTTIIGYELAKLKDDEATLLEERGRLNMQYADLVSQKNLEQLSTKKSNSKNKEKISDASKIVPNKKDTKTISR